GWVVRRAVPAMFIGLVFFATLGGLLPYKYRFDSRGLAKDRSDGLDYYRAPVDLKACLDRDRDNQRQFDEALVAYARAEDNLNLARAQHKNAVVQMKNGIVVAPAELKKLEDAVNAAARTVALNKRALRDKWNAMEVQNQVVAGHVIRPDLDLQFLSRDEH